MMDTKNVLLREEDAESAYVTMISFLTDEEARTLVCRMIQKALEDSVDAWDAFHDANDRVVDMVREKSRLYGAGYLDYMHDIRAADNDRSDALDEALSAQKRLNVLLQKYGTNKKTEIAETTETTTKATIHIMEDDDDDDE